MVVLSIETVAADEFADDAGGRDLVIHVGFVDVIKNLDHVADLVIAIIVRFNGGEQREDVLLQYGQLVEGGAIENNVGVFLEGEDPLFFATAHRIPHG